MALRLGFRNKKTADNDEATGAARVDEAETVQNAGPAGEGPDPAGEESVAQATVSEAIGERVIDSRFDGHEITVADPAEALGRDQGEEDPFAAQFGDIQTAA